VRARATNPPDAPRESMLQSRPMQTLSLLYIAAKSTCILDVQRLLLLPAVAIVASRVDCSTSITKGTGHKLRKPQVSNIHLLSMPFCFDANHALLMRQACSGTPEKQCEKRELCCDKTAPKRMPVTCHGYELFPITGMSEPVVFFVRLLHKPATTLF
jgi:hypothetical protein